jgi:hypothetical protein
MHIRHAACITTRSLSLMANNLYLKYVHFHSLKGYKHEQHNMNKHSEILVIWAHSHFRILCYIWLISCHLASWLARHSISIRHSRYISLYLENFYTHLICFPDTLTVVYIHLTCAK